MLRVLTESRIEFHRHTNSAKTFFIFSVVENLNSFADSRDFRKLIEKTVLGAVLVELHALNNLTVERTKTQRRTGRGGGEGGGRPPPPPPPPPPNFGQLRFCGQREKIWAKPVF